jgi:hypothetical protein
MGKRYVFSNGATVYAQKNSTEFQVIGSTGLLYSQEKPVYMPDSTAYNPFAVESIATGSSEGATLTPYGISDITAVAGVNSSALNVTLSAPITGALKYINVHSTADLVGNMNIILSGATLQMASSDAGFGFISMSTLGTMQALTLAGLSTAKWGLVSAESTGGVFSAAAGIRASTALSS